MHFNMTHTCHINMQEINVKADYCGIIVLHWSCEFIIFHEQIFLQPVGPGFIPQGGVCKSLCRDRRML